MKLNAGTIIAGIVGGGATLLTAVSVPFVAPAFRKVCIPYVPATTQQLENIRKALSQVKSVGSVIDLGSGDGRVTIHCAKQGYVSSGVELNRILVWYSKYNAFKAGSYSNTHFFRQNMFKVDLKKYDSAVLFGAESTMDNLLEKLNEMNVGSHLVACRFPLPKESDTHWAVKFQGGEGMDAAWLYKKIA
uniref:Protein FAM173B n=1 Tax=Rhabditophanes sp. KR3021 TaxID=114890 RepID=A0AC35TQ03_9BILA